MRSTTLAVILVFICLAVVVNQGYAADIPGKRAGFASLWVPRAVDLSRPQIEVVKNAGTLGENIEDKQWRVISTKYHLLYYQDTIDKNTLKQVARCVDNIYDFLKMWNPATPKIPIKAFLTPDQGQSKCSPEDNAMRTWEGRSFALVLTSLLHEETHLFNFAYLDRQGSWAGEFSCHYFQQRARLEANKQDVKRYVDTKLPNGPNCTIGEIADQGQERLDESFSVFYYLHKAYGDEVLFKFRCESLRIAKNSQNIKRDSVDAFRIATGKQIDALDSQWRKFYGWEDKKSDKTAGAVSNQDISPAAKLTRGVVAELASPEYQGRAAGGPGENRASEYVAGQFKLIGLVPINPRGTYLQPFNVAHRELVGPIGLRIRDREFTYKSDFGILRGGPTQWAEGGMYFVGLGTTDDGKLSFDKNKIHGKVLVAIIRQKLRPIDDKLYETAKDSGAAGLLLIYPPDLYDAALFARKNNQLKDELPVISLSPRVGEYLLSIDSPGLSKLQKQLRAGKSAEIDIQGICRLAAGVAYKPESESHNVVARLKTSNPKKSGILIYAHYDGQGREGPKNYYPSSNDNASGVAVITAIASLLSSRRTDLSRDVYCAALGAEELGDLGAKKLLDSKVIPWKEVGLTICIDMVGRMDQGILTAVTTSDKSPEYLAIKDYAERQGCKVKSLVREGLGSDAQVIKRSGVPTLFIITAGGPHHIIEDDANNTNPSDMGRLAELLAGFIIDLP